MLEKIIITSLCITAIHVSMMEGMILFRVRQWMDAKFPAFLKKPLYECLVCMCSFWGTIFFFWFAGVHNIHTWIVFILAVGGVNAVINVFINKSIVEKEPLPSDVVKNVEDFINNASDCCYEKEKKLVSKLYDYCRKL